MFTGMIREIGTLRGLSPRGDVLRVAIAAPRTAALVALGDSVSVDGICLTVTGSRPGVFSVEAASETRRLTTLGQWRTGRRVHLESALRVGDSLDGHFVQGHIDGTGRVKSVRAAPDGGRLVTIELVPELAAMLTSKGSVAVDGVSLTVDSGPFAGSFTVNLIPHTLTTTNLGALAAGATVNLETDLLVKAVRGAGRLDRTEFGSASPAPREAPALTAQRLRSLGFASLRRRDRT